jgi:2-polyprenyl-3-methyl-5-hydroxy-6-metoxy-1,4-benzoquinol methylase
MNCDLCGENTTKKLCDIGTTTILQCEECGLMYRTPIPTQEELKKYYSSGYYQEYGFREYAARKEHIIKYRFEPILNFFKDVIERDRFIKDRLKGKPVFLDIGCALGFFIELLKNQGYEAKGVEFSYDAAQYAKKNLGLEEVYTGSVEEVGFEPECFDVITLLDVLEHVVSPNTILKETNRILKKEGLVLASIPNVSAAEARGKRGLSEFLFAEGHLFNFPYDTLKRLFNINGFNIIGITSLSIPRRWLDYEVPKKLFPQIRAIYRKVNRFIWNRTMRGGLIILVAKKVY